MRPGRNDGMRERANVLVITLIMCALMGMVLLAYMQLIQGRTKVRARSAAWNAAIPVLESGIEEAFSHLHQDSTNLTANSWTRGGTNSTVTYQKSRTNSDGSFYSVTISNAASTPITAPMIYSRGFVPGPLKQDFLSRTVCITTSNSSTFSKGILTRNAITTSGDFQIDSFDSSNTNYSNNGLYSSNKFLANGDIASMAGGTSIKIAGSKIYGHIAYPPSGGYTIGSGVVGDAAYVGANSGTVESGYNDNTLNVSIPDAQSPPTDPSTWSSPAMAFLWTNGITYAYVLYNGNYTVGATTLKGSILVLGNASLYIAPAGRVQFGSSDVIKIVSGSKLQMYNASSIDAVFTGLSNDSGMADRFTYWGLNTTAGSKLTLTGNSQAAGVIYAPYQDIVATGGSSSLPRDFIGSIVANSLVTSGHFYMSYDQALGGGTGAPVIVSYREL